jgi:hypothetical protein
MTQVDFRRVKETAFRELPAGHPAREVILAQPDVIDLTTLDALFPTLVTLLRAKPRL